MYQSVIRALGSGNLVSIVPDVCDRNNAVVNGSILIVPAGTTAYVTINGMVSHPYGPGRYQLFTGVDPFFVRLRNILTQGDTGTSVSVFFISNEKIRHMQTGTGEIPFKERRFNLTMKAFAACNLAYSIGNPTRFVKTIVGMGSSDFSQDDIDPFIENLIMTSVRQALAGEMGRMEVTQFNANLSRVKRTAMASISDSFSKFGMKLEHFDVVAINVPETEMRRLHSLEEEYAAGKTRTDIELDNLQRIWNGNTNNRMMSEMLTGLPSRGQAPQQGGSPTTNSGMGSMSPLIQMAALSQMMPLFRDSFNSITQHTDMLGQTRNTPQQSTSSADSPPPVPGRYRRCPSCNGNVDLHRTSCPVCGYRFNERRN